MTETSRRGLAAFLVATAASFLAMAVWSLSSPLTSSPDEPVHMIKAAAVVRGELIGRRVGSPTQPLGVVDVPAFYANLKNIPDCYHRKPTIPASCAPATHGGSTTKPVVIYVAPYPPLYYAIVGIPSLLGDHDAELYLMRLVSALLSALMIGLAAFSIARWSSSRLALGGLVVAATPMVLFLGGTVNPAGLEASAGIALWASGSVLVLEHLDDPPLGLVAVATGTAALLALIGPISPFWVALIAALLLAVADWRAVLGAVRLRRVQIAAGLLFVVGALATAWIVANHSYDTYSTSHVPMSVPETTILATSFEHNDFYVPGMIGVFGWFDTWSPQLTYIVWYLMVGLLALGGAVVSKLRPALTLVVTAVAIVVVPVAISSSQVHRLGYIWSGKETLPLAVGLPILGAALLARSSLERHASRLTGLVCAAAFVAQCAAFYEMLRRYAVGTKGPYFSFLFSSKWQPIIGLKGALVWEVAVLAIAGLVTWAAVQRGHAATVAPAPALAGEEAA